MNFVTLSNKKSLSRSRKESFDATLWEAPVIRFGTNGNVFNYKNDFHRFSYNMLDNFSFAPRQAKYDIK